LPSRAETYGHSDQLIVPIPHHNHAFVAFVKLLRLCRINNMGDSKTCQVRGSNPCRVDRSRLCDDDQEIRPAIAYALLLFTWRTRQFISLPTHKVGGCLGTPKWLQP
jgi:hypothetical protein